MRPDRHKQAASRRYQAKIKARGGANAASTSASGSGHGNARQRNDQMARREHQAGNSVNDTESENEDEDSPRRSYGRRKIVSNLDRYVEKDEQVSETEELEQGYDRQTMALEELLLDSNQKHSFDQATYFRFKSEIAAEDFETAATSGSSVTATEEGQHAQKWMEIQLDDLETSLMRLPLTERLFLSEADQQLYGYGDSSDVEDRGSQEDIICKVSFNAGTPIVPKLVRGEAAEDILIQPSKKASGVPEAKPSKGARIETKPVDPAQHTPQPAPGIKQLSNVETRRQQAKASKNQDLDDLLEQSKRTVVSVRDLPKAQPAAVLNSSPKLPLTQSTSVGRGAQPSSPASPSSTSGTSATRSIPLPVPNKPNISSQRPATKVATPLSKPKASKVSTNLDDEWLDSMLG
ncbi:hypothetical protein BGW41_005855 [Actinomortierella wolfii]|nr:hypothetical protein BGW41_005855 [Actinomortierella wolfii]